MNAVGSSSRRLGRIGLIVVGLVVALLAGELVLALVYGDSFRDRFDPHPIEHGRWTAHPFFPFLGRPATEYTLHMPERGVNIEVRNNAYGYRAHELPADKGAEDYFIVALGGSTTEGAIARTNAETWPELLEGMLAERYPHRRVRAFNLGVSGSTAAFSVVSLALVATHIEPDLVIVYHGFNDYGPVMSRRYRTDYRHHFGDLRPEGIGFGLRHALPAALRASRTVTFGAYALDSAMGVNELAAEVEKDLGPQFGDPADGVPRLVDQFETIRSLATGVGADVLFSTFQFADGDDFTRTELNRILREHYTANDLYWVDQAALIPDHDDSLQIDECHFTDEGRRRLARNFFDEIVELGLLEREPAPAAAPAPDGPAGPARPAGPRAGGTSSTGRAGGVGGQGG